MADDRTEQRCQCFGSSGLHASTHGQDGSDQRHCDFCDLPVQDGAVDALTAINAQDQPGRPG